MAPSSLLRHFSSQTQTQTYWPILLSHSPPPPLELHLSSHIPSPSPSLILSTLSTSSTPPSSHILSLRLLLWSLLHPNPNPHHLLPISSHLLSLPSNPHLLHSLLDSYLIHSPPPLPSKSFTHLLLLSSLSHHPFPFTVSLFRRMPDFHCLPDLPTFHTLLRHPSIPSSSALSLFQELKSSPHSFKPNLSTYLNIVKILCKDFQLGSARDLVSTMEKDSGCTPNVVVYSALLDGACAIGDLDAANEIFNAIEAPNVVTYTCLMKCLCERGKLEEALGLLDRMGRCGVRPNRVTVRTLLKGFCENGRVEDAYRVVERMEGFSSKECYSLLVLGLLRAGDWEHSEGLLGRMVERGVRPDGVALNEVLRGVCERGRFLDGYSWIGVVEEKWVGCVDKDVCSSVLAGLCEEGHWVEAVKLARRVVESGGRVEDCCVDCVVDVMEKVGERELASQTRRMKEKDDTNAALVQW